MLYLNVAHHLSTFVSEKINNAMTTQLTNNDTIYATVTFKAQTVAQLTLSGFSSMAELMKNICHRLAGLAGLVTTELRNSNGGWKERRSLRLRPVEATQLSLF